MRKIYDKFYDCCYGMAVYILDFCFAVFCTSILGFKEDSAVQANKAGSHIDLSVLAAYHLFDMSATTAVIVGKQIDCNLSSRWLVPILLLELAASY